jgi:hypothetical protein
MQLVPLSDSAISQYINSRNVFEELERTRRQLLDFRGTMFWKHQEGRPQDYLIRATSRNSQKSLGARSAQTEAMYTKFTQAKAQTQARVKDLEKELARCEARNRGYEVGRTPELIVKILAQVAAQGLAEHLTVIGSHALYAFESAGFVRIEQALLQTNDVDFLWDNRKRLSFEVREGLSEKGILGMLQKVDATFALHAERMFTAVNSKGFEVDLVRRKAKDSAEKQDRARRRPSEVDEDFWPSEITTGEWLLSAPRFSAMVVSASGKMARMNTVDPRAFALAKMYLADKPTREPGKKMKDHSQAMVVHRLIQEYLPALSFNDVKTFPKPIFDRLTEEAHRFFGGALANA